MNLESEFTPPEKKRTWVVLKLALCATVVIIIVCIARFSAPTISSVPKSSNERLPISGSVISPQGVRIDVQVADDDSERELGLSFQESLPERTGMLFVFPQMGTYQFWMKDMKFPIDIVWIDESFHIVDRTINVLPESFPETFSAQAPAKYILEIPANTADSSGFVIGSIVTIDQN